MDTKLIGKELLECVDLEKVGAILIDNIIDAELKKIIADSTNKFDDAAYALLAPILLPQAKIALAKLVADLKA